MTATGATNAAPMAPPAPGTGGGLPPALPAGFDPPATTGGGAAAPATTPPATTPPATTTTPATSTPPATTTTPPATAATSTTFLPATNTMGGGFAQIPAPGGCTTPPPGPIQGGGAPGKDPVQMPPGKDPVQGGGPTGDLGPVLQQLTGVLQQLSTAVGGVSGGGAAPGKDPVQDPGKDPVQGGGAPAPSTPSTPPTPSAPPTGAVAGASGGGATPSTVAGANGAAGANAAAGAAQVQGGGVTAPADNAALVSALQSLLEILTKLVQALGGQISGGGPGQLPPGKDLPPPPSDVKGDSGKGDPTQAPPKGDVKGDHGPGQKPEQKDPGQKPEQKDPGQKPPVVPPPPTQVGGEQGPGQTPTQSPVQSPVQTPVQTPPPPPKPAEPPKVGGENGGPKTPEQTPTQTPTQTPPPKEPVVAKGNVILDNDDERWSAKLTAKGGKGGEDSVELWGDPHVVITVDGKAEKFDIGFGAGKVKLFDGTVISWDTYDKGHDHQFILRDFKINSPGEKFDRNVTTRDRNGDKGDEMNLSTALSQEHLVEFATALRTMQGPMDKPLKNGTWVSPQLGKDPVQTPTQGGVVQQS